MHDVIGVGAFGACAVVVEDAGTVVVVVAFMDSTVELLVSLLDKFGCLS